MPISGSLYLIPYVSFYTDTTGAMVFGKLDLAQPDPPLGIKRIVAPSPHSILPEPRRHGYAGFQDILHAIDDARRLDLAGSLRHRAYHCRVRVLAFRQREYRAGYDQPTRDDARVQGRLSRPAPGLGAPCPHPIIALALESPPRARCGDGEGKGA